MQEDFNERKEQCHFGAGDDTSLEMALNGGKAYLAERIIALFPRHLHYCEPFFGGGAVLFHRDPNDESLWLPPHKGVSEVVGDLNQELTNFWKVLRDPQYFGEFYRRAQCIPLSRIEFEEADEALSKHEFFGPIDSALRFFVACRQSRAGGFKGFTSLTRNRLRRGINGNASEWLGAVDGLPEVHARLRPVVVENMPAVDLLRREDGPGMFTFCDPPYVHSTRATKDAYAHEMTREQHVELLDTLASIKGKFALSGYRSDLYDDYAKQCGWRRVDWEIPNHAAGGKEKRIMVESCWMNY